MERTECMTVIVTSAGEISWILSRCETRWFHGAGMLHCRPCLVHACQLFDWCSNSPPETERIIHVLDILHVLSVLLVRDVTGKWHESCLCFPLWVSLLYKMVNWTFVWQMPCRIFETLLGTKLIAVIPCWIMCTWCHQAHCIPWAWVMVFSTKQVLAKQFAGLSKSFLNRIKYVPFPFPTGQAYNVWKCCTFSET